MPLRVRGQAFDAAGPTGGGLSTEAESGIIGGKTGPDTGKGGDGRPWLSLYLAALESDGDEKQFRELYPPVSPGDGADGPGRSCMTPTTRRRPCRRRFCG